MPRGLATAETIAAIVLDLAVLQPASVEPWMEAFDPQGEYLHQGDDWLWALRELHGRGLKRVVALVADSENGPAPQAMALRIETDRDPLPILEGIAELPAWLGERSATWMRHLGAPEELALVEWQPGWWVLDSPAWTLSTHQASSLGQANGSGQVDDSSQTNEWGLALQQILAQSRGAPVRVAVAPSQTLLDRKWIPLANSLGGQILLGSLAPHAANWRSLSLSMDAKGRSPRLRLQLTFHTEESVPVLTNALAGAKAEFDQVFESGFLQSGLTANGGPQNTKLEPIASMLPSNSSAWKWDAFLRTTQKAVHAVEYQPAATTATFVLGRDFFDCVRHVRNLATQPDGGLAAALGPMPEH